MQQKPLQEKHLGPLPFWAPTNAQPAQWFRSVPLGLAVPKPASRGDYPVLYTQRVSL